MLCVAEASASSNSLSRRRQITLEVGERLPFPLVELSAVGSSGQAKH
jgi:hypothetical protein